MQLSKPRSWPRRLRLAFILGLCLSGIVEISLVPRMPTGPHYHDFADKQFIASIPNAFDVLSNIPFFIVGVWGLIWLLGSASRRAFLDTRERIPWLIFFTGVALTGIGSFWYHLAPSDARLPWDLLPMTCSFMSIVAITFMERVDLDSGFVALAPLLLLGMGSVVYWYAGNAHGNGDYKFYLFVQFFSPVLLTAIIGLFPPRYSGMRYLVIAFGLYVAAKLFELYDYSIYGLGHIVSGHSLKHVTGAISCYWILRMLKARHPTVFDQTPHDIGASRDTNVLSWARD